MFANITSRIKGFVKGLRQELSHGKKTIVAAVENIYQDPKTSVLNRFAPAIIMVVAVASVAGSLTLGWVSALTGAYMNKKMNNSESTFGYAGKLVIASVIGIAVNFLVDGWKVALVAALVASIYVFGGPKIAKKLGKMPTLMKTIGAVGAIVSMLLIPWMGTIGTLIVSAIGWLFSSLFHAIVADPATTFLFIVVIALLVIVIRMKRELKANRGTNPAPVVKPSGGKTSGGNGHRGGKASGGKASGGKASGGKTSGGNSRRGRKPSGSKPAGNGTGGTSSAPRTAASRPNPSMMPKRRTLAATQPLPVVSSK
jgi:hypothetical protein